MQLIGEFTVADVYVSAKSGRTSLTLIPDNGGIMKLTVDGSVQNLVARDNIRLDTVLKVRNYPSGGMGLEIDPSAIKKIKDGKVQS